MVLTTISFTVMQTGVRWVATDTANPLPPVEVAFFRNLFGVVALAPVLFTAGFSIFKTQRLGMHFGRAFCQSTGMVCFFTALTMVPLAKITALSFSAPLFATLLAIVVIGERVRARRITALVLGFIGVMIVLQPRFDSFELGGFLVLASSTLWAVAMTFIKSLSRTESAVTITLYAGVFLVPMTGIPALFVWVHPTLEQLLWLLGIGAVGTIGHLAFAQSFKHAEMSAVLPFDFLRLIWASAIGYMLFGEIPTWITWIGGALIFSAACYIGIREAQLAKRNKTKPSDTA